MTEANKELKTQLDGRPVDALEPTTDRYARLVLLNWLGRATDEVPPRGDSTREVFLRELALSVDLLSDAVAFIVWKVVGQPFTVAGPERTARKWRDKLLGSNYTTVIAQWVRSACTSDVGGWCKILRYPPRWAVDAQGQLTERGRQAEADGKAATWEVAGLEPLDSTRITPTGNPEAPIWYAPATGGGPLLLHRSQVVQILDSPISDATLPGYGQCGVSRCLDVGRLRGYIAAYFREAFGDKPRPGLVILNNIMAADWDAIRQRAEVTEQQKGLKYIGEQLVLTSAEATAPASATEVPFRVAPAGWDQPATYNECKEITADAWGLDPLEFGAMPGEGLGSGKQATTMAAKSRGKFIAFILSSIEREFRRVLPSQLEFAFVSNDLEEKLALLEVQRQEIDNVNAMYTGRGADGLGAGNVGLITREEGRQLLADAEVLPREFVVTDPTDQAAVTDTESTAENIVKCFSTGPVIVVRRCRVHRKQHEHNPATIGAVRDYESRLAQIYADWADDAAAQLATTPGDKREEKLAALLLLLASSLKRAGRDGLTQAYELGLDGEELDDEMQAELDAAIAANDAYIDDSLIPDVQARFLTDTSAPDFNWQEPELGEALQALAYRTGNYGGAFWATIGLGLARMLAKRHADPPVRRYLDPQAQHCGTCPPKEKRYSSWAAMVEECGGVPGDGSDECGPGCRCMISALIDGQWIDVL